MTATDKIKFLFAVPLGFLTGLFVMTLLAAFQVGGFGFGLVLAGGFGALILFNMVTEQVGNSFIFRTIARLSNMPASERAAIDAELDDRGSPIPRYLTVLGFGIAVAVCLIWSPLEVLDWVQRRPFL